MPDPDLLIRTSGELRISNFLLWQIAYTEIFVTERYWPDFRGIHLLEAIADFQRRERRYGGIGEDGGEVEEDFERIKIARLGSVPENPCDRKSSAQAADSTEANRPFRCGALRAGWIGELISYRRWGLDSGVYLSSRLTINVTAVIAARAFLENARTLSRKTIATCSANLRCTWKPATGSAEAIAMLNNQAEGLAPSRAQCSICS